MLRPTSILFFIATGFSQNIVSTLPIDPGMYVETRAGFSKFIGQSAEFKRTGSRLVNDATLGIKAGKVNIQLLGAHADTIVSAQPVFCFIPARQEAEVGLNAGDLILIRLEEKSKRRQFEVAAAGLWRSSSGITLTHQYQLDREEIRPNVYKIMPKTELEKGEYALYLARGEGMSPYVYDFSVQPGVNTINTKEDRTASNWNITQPEIVADTRKTNVAAPTNPANEQVSIGVFAEGNINMRHDGITLTAVSNGGPADQVGIKAGDVILAINDHYIFTIAELRDAISRLTPGQNVSVRYRHNTAINDVSIVAMTVQ
jgi:hypothetical protein